MTRLLAPHRWVRLLGAAGALAAGTLLAGAGPASAHVTVEPLSASAGQLVELTFTVPNEQPDQDTIALDVRLPKGFLLETAQTVPGWTTRVDLSPSKIPTAVHWTGGRSAPKTFVSFAIRGRMPSGGSTALFPATQRYERTVAEWSDADQTSDKAGPVVTLQADVKGTDGSSLPQVPVASGAAGAGTGAGAAAGAAAGGTPGEDALARSRSSLALALGLGAFLLGLGSLGATLLLRREGARAGGGPAADDAPPAAAADQAKPNGKATGKGEPKPDAKPDARAGTGKRR